MKNGLFTSIWNGKDLGENDMSHLTAPKAGLYPKKVMLCLWWDWKGIVYYELLPYNQTINSDKYCSQLDRLKAAIDEKCPELANLKDVVFHQNNARPHVSLHTRQKLVQLGWDVLSYSPYSPDLDSTLYILLHIFIAYLDSFPKYYNKTFFH